MKFYYLDTIFTFGKYSGKTLREMLEIEPSYIDWCTINLDHFYIPESVIDEIKSIKPDFALSEEGRQKMADKEEEWEQEKEERRWSSRYNYEYDKDDWRAVTFDALTDGMCGDYYDDYEGDVDFDSIKTFLGRD
jgi:hypothetical protein